MQKKLLVLFVTMLCARSYAQISFEKGYFIDESERKTECLIKNIDWKNNPSEFEYKLSQDGVSKVKTIKTTKEFGITGYSKFIRAHVNIDRSNDERISSLSTTRAPDFHKEELFLKVLIEGKASLYYYEGGNTKRYFFKHEDQSEIQPLIFKKYITQNNKIGTNVGYKQQLWDALKCEEISRSTIERLDYTQSSLAKIFIKYNSCTSSEYISYKKRTKLKLHLALRPGVKFSSLDLQIASKNRPQVEFGNKTGFRLGIEGEFILPFNNNKWAILVEPTYQYYKAEETVNVNDVSGRKIISRIDYKSIELPISVRHYFYLNDTSKLYINAAIVLDFDQDSSLRITRADGSSLYPRIDLDSYTHLALGAGYTINDKYSLELRYQSRQIVRYGGQWDSDYRSLSVILGYRLF